jgi:hypothetical protein
MSDRNSPGDESLTLPPHLARLFDALRRGKHLSEGDGPHVVALREHVATYARLFDAFGFSLVQHARGFFYFAADPSSTVTDQSARMVVFVFVLVEHLADRGDPVEDTLMTKTFKLADLPHLTTERYKVYMRDVGVSSQEDLALVIKSMCRLGVAEQAGEGFFRFRTPAYRFLDLCSDLATEQAAAHEDAASLADEDESESSGDAT